MHIPAISPKIMAIINLGAGSFCSEGRVSSVDAALQHALAAIADGADILDIGAEPTNPHCTHFSISPDEELALLLPVIKAIRQHNTQIPISIDTSQPAVMTAAIDAGASMINDVRALRRDGALATAASLNVPVCLMHMQYPNGMPEQHDLDTDPYLGDVVSAVEFFLFERVARCLDAGISRDNLIIDPGFGGGAFGKTTEQNIRLLQQLSRFAAFDLPLLVGVSRKSWIGDILDANTDDRLIGSVTAAVSAALRGATILRVHDVKATAQALAIGLL